MGLNLRHHETRNFIPADASPVELEVVRLIEAKFPATRKMHVRTNARRKLNSLTPEAQIVTPEFRAALLKFARRNVNEDEAQDLCADTTMRCWEAVQSGHYKKQDGVPFIAYALQIMVNRFADMKRKQRRLVLVENFETYAAQILKEDPAQEKGGLLLQPVQKIIDTLPQQQKDALITISLGASFQEAAQDAGVPLGTMKSRYERARLTLREKLQDYYAPTPAPGKA